MDDADDATCAQVYLDVAGAYCAASHPPGVTINRTARDRNARDQARFFGRRFRDRPNDLFTGEEVRHNLRIQTNFREEFFIELVLSKIIRDSKERARREICRRLPSQLESDVPIDGHRFVYPRERFGAILLFPHQVYKCGVIFQPVAANLEEPIFANVVAQPLHLLRSSAIH